jgi:hypothetical protein
MCSARRCAGRCPCSDYCRDTSERHNSVVCHRRRPHPTRHPHSARVLSGLWNDCSASLPSIHLPAPVMRPLCVREKLKSIEQPCRSLEVIPRRLKSPVLAFSAGGRIRQAGNLRTTQRYIEESPETQAPVNSLHCSDPSAIEAGGELPCSTAPRLGPLKGPPWAAPLMRPRPRRA